MTDFKHKQFPLEWEWLLREPGPKILLEAISHYGILEHPGKGSFPNFDRWTYELGISQVITDDDIPWCGVFVGICALRAGWDVPLYPYRALQWLTWGQAATIPELGCVLVFNRKGGGHVGFYVGETNKEYAVLGGNQSNMVNISLIEKSRLMGQRECPWRIAKPGNIRPVHLAVDNAGRLISTNEA